MRRVGRSLSIITLEELADEFGVSRERVRQIEVRAFEKVQKGGEDQHRLDGKPGPRRRAMTSSFRSRAKGSARGER
jgi:Sigma-70, region 4